MVDGYWQLILQTWGNFKTSLLPNGRLEFAVRAIRNRDSTALLYILRFQSEQGNSDLLPKDGPDFTKCARSLTKKCTFKTVRNALFRCKIIGNFKFFHNIIKILTDGGWQEGGEKGKCLTRWDILKL